MDIEALIAKIPGLKNYKELEEYVPEGSDVSVDNRDAFVGYLSLLTSIMSSFTYLSLASRLAEVEEDGSRVLVMLGETTYGGWARVLRLGELERCFVEDAANPIIALMRSDLHDRATAALATFFTIGTSSKEEAREVADSLASPLLSEAVAQAIQSLIFPGADESVN